MAKQVCSAHPRVTQVTQRVGCTGPTRSLHSSGMPSQCETCGTLVAREIDCPTCGRPGFDVVKAREVLIGKVVLIGLRYQQDTESEPRLVTQMHGRVDAVDEHRGISVRMEGSHAGQRKTLPPDLRPFFAAAPGYYTDQATGEVIEDPDFIVTYRVSGPSQKPAPVESSPPEASNGTSDEFTWRPSE
jgi:hypothetical protein